MTSSRKHRVNKQKSLKNKIKFTFTKNEDCICSHGDFIQRILEKNDKWVYRKLNPCDIVDWMNCGSTKLLKNSVLNNYIGDSVCELTNKYDFHKNLYGKEYIPIEKELELLEKAFTFANNCGPAKAARWLSTASGRRISNPGLTKRMKIGVHLDR